MSKIPNLSRRWGPSAEEMKALGYDWDTREGDISAAFKAWEKANPDRARRRDLFRRVSKSEIYEAAIHLAALCHESGSYDLAIQNGGAEDRLIHEIRTLAANENRKTKA